VTDNVYCLVKIIEKDERIIVAVQFEIKLSDFFYQSTQLSDYIYMDIYCKLSKCIEQAPCSYKHYLVISNFISAMYTLTVSNKKISKVSRLLKFKSIKSSLIHALSTKKSRKKNFLPDDFFPAF